MHGIFVMKIITFNPKLNRRYLLSIAKNGLHTSLRIDQISSNLWWTLCVFSYLLTLVSALVALFYLFVHLSMKDGHLGPWLEVLTNAFMWIFSDIFGLNVVFFQHADLSGFERAGLWCFRRTAWSLKPALWHSATLWSKRSPGRRPNCSPKSPRRRSTKWRYN